MAEVSMTVDVTAAIFDLDGTLTAPGAIRFEGIRTRIGMPTSGSILAWIAANARDQGERARMEAHVWEEERLALERMELGLGFSALARAIQTRGASLKTAICTRNSGEALVAFDALLRRSGFPPSAELFHVQIARAHFSEHLQREIENKPSHEPVHEIIRRWGLTQRFAPTIAHEHEVPRHTPVLFVGDDVDDCLSARRAGVRSGLIRHGSRAPEQPAFAKAVDRHFDDLSEVAAALTRPPQSG
ncbi:MAG: HAD hydrolase-like protein [Planctomycetota bacterium]|nr:HAD hydrolase-like protein [Planctomycetota bacterium]MDG1986166.1 HAD hydrolase-like protein [Planctomycetota bacterium]